MVTTYLQKLRLFSRNMRLWLVFIAVYAFCYMGIYLVLFNLYLVRLGYGPEFVGIVNSAQQFVSVAFFMPAVALGGRWGLRRTIIVGASIAVVGLALVPVAEVLSHLARAAWIVTTYSLVGLSYALWVTNAGPFMMNGTTPEERGHLFSTYFALVPLGAFVGNLVGGALPGMLSTILGVPLDGPAPYRFPLWVAALLLVAAPAVLLATRQDEAAIADETSSEAERAPVALITVAALVMLLQFAADAVARTFFNLYLDSDLHVSTARVGALSAAGQLFAVPAPLIVPALIARWDRYQILAWGTLGMALSLVLLALFPHWTAAGLGFIGVVALSMMVRCVAYPYFMELASPRWQATMSGAGNLAVGSSFSAMALGGGFIVTALGYRSLFLVAAAVTTAGALLFWAYFRVPRGELARGSAPDGSG